jgi:NACalpha-BTF3-like transcription factor
MFSFLLCVQLGRGGLCRERELAAVKIDLLDVKTIASEFEIDVKAAERRLREHKGDVVAALKSFF